ncbi:uncharacterized protein LOC107227672 [Neodiprion lecontei]|uniref:Uncharacterized protein LOC107227672 n=1 Tax=Neodiprion lecontei TaxID=441921 RepID=A0A6J0CCR3_NEOLC|nr:uncharacterized protein LOC107227672 [Neodiprion lecontei]
MTIEVRDLDEITTGEEIRVALSSALKASLEDEMRLRSGFRGIQAALIRMLGRTAQKLLTIGKINIGLTVCQIQGRITVDGCYRCQGYGHHAAKCLDIDNLNACRRCSMTEHKKKECGRSSPRCIVCTNGGVRADHFAGSDQCRASKAELLKAKDRRNGRATIRVPNYRTVESTGWASVEPVMLFPTTLGGSFGRRLDFSTLLCQE